MAQSFNKYKRPHPQNGCSLLIGYKMNWLFQIDVVDDPCAYVAGAELPAFIACYIGRGHTCR